MAGRPVASSQPFELRLISPFETFPCLEFCFFYRDTSFSNIHKETIDLLINRSFLACPDLITFSSTFPQQLIFLWPVFYFNPLAIKNSIISTARWECWLSYRRCCHSSVLCVSNHNNNSADCESIQITPRCAMILRCPFVVPSLSSDL